MLVDDFKHWDHYLFHFALSSKSLVNINKNYYKHNWHSLTLYNNKNKIDNWCELMQGRRKGNGNQVVISSELERGP